MNRSYFPFLFLLVAFVGGIYAMYLYQQAQAPKRQEQADVLLERAQNVMKLIAVEGYFSEIYDIKEYQGFDMWPFQKKALVRVKAKVSIGYDLSEMNIKTDAATHTVHIRALGEPEILSIDHNLDYYDISEGIFNSFTPEDHNRIAANAKEFIRQQAIKSDLIDMARKQRNVTFQTLQTIVESSGWKMEIDTTKTPLD